MNLVKYSGAIFIEITSNEAAKLFINPNKIGHSELYFIIFESFVKQNIILIIKKLNKIFFLFRS